LLLRWRAAEAPPIDCDEVFYLPAAQDPLYGMAWGQLVAGGYPLEVDSYNLGMTFGLGRRGAFVAVLGVWTAKLLHSSESVERPA
jgi:hypothetical protein